MFQYNVIITSAITMITLHTIVNILYTIIYKLYTIINDYTPFPGNYKELFTII